MSAADKAQANYDEAKSQAKQTADEAKSQAKQTADKAQANFIEAKDDAKQKARQAKGTLLERLEDDGVVNPSGLSVLAFSGIFFAAIPLTNWIAQPNSLLEKAVNGVCSSIAYVGSAGAVSTVPPSGRIAALGALYVGVTYAISGAGSAAGVAAGNKEGRDNKEPRKQVAGLTGLPLRLHSAHYNLMEMFPSWAIAAALTQAMAPRDTTLVNLLGLHVLSKVFLYYPSYLLNYDQPRSVGHILATGSVISVLLKLARLPLI